MGFAGPVAVSCICTSQPSIRLPVAQGQASYVSTVVAAETSPLLNQ